jgi:GNAT superfamily N-acetyltransferase
MYTNPVVLTNEHNTEEFDCGISVLNSFLKKHALQNQLNHSARTYVTLKGNKVVGFYSLAPASVEYDEVPSRVSKGLAKHSIPCILLARIAVDKHEQTKGLGKALLKDALLKAYNAKDVIGGRAVITYAKNTLARNYYLKFGFEPSPIDEFHLFILMKDIEKILNS